MNNQKITIPKKLKISRSAILALGFVIFSIIFCYGSLLFWKVGFSLNRMVSYLYYDWENLEIDASEIPVYPNAKIISITYNEPTQFNVIKNVSTWKFTTNDAPDTVWKFYVGEMGRKWGFYEWPLLPESPLRLIIMHCPTYNLYMTSSSIDNTTYQVTIKFISGPCY